MTPRNSWGNCVFSAYVSRHGAGAILALSRKHTLRNDAVCLVTFILGDQQGKTKSVCGTKYTREEARAQAWAQILNIEGQLPGPSSSKENGLCFRAPGRTRLSLGLEFSFLCQVLLPAVSFSPGSYNSLYLLSCSRLTVDTLKVV